MNKISKSPELESLELEMNKIGDQIQKLTNQDQNENKSQIWKLLREQNDLIKKV